METNKRQELLGYLLVYRQRPHHREHLANLFWGSTNSTTQSKKYLRQALWQLSSDFEGCSLDKHLLLMDTDWVGINPEARFSLDIADFEEIHQQVRNIKGEELVTSHVQALKGAVQLYRGHLLETSYQDWCIYERERFFRMYLIMLFKLMTYSRHKGDYESGILYGTEMLRHDAAQENTHRQLMLLYYLSGNRTAAIRQYDICVEALRRELDVEVSKRTSMLYEKIKSDQLETNVDDAPPPQHRRIKSNSQHLVYKINKLEEKIDRLEGYLGQFIQFVARFDDQSGETPNRH
ncbi:MAG: hypothetical protein OHK0046_41660 [Anaerolineae bacterium]